MAAVFSCSPQRTTSDITAPTSYVDTPEWLLKKQPLAFLDEDDYGDLIHGICESAETKGVQFLVREALASDKFLGKIAVLELEGHGLSSGAKCVCPDFYRLVGHVVEAVESVESQLFPGNPPSVYLTGNSLGGALIIYAANQLLAENYSTTITIKGIAPIAPAVGMDSTMLPPTPLVWGLKALAYVRPSLQVSLTPYEDPTSYNCPATTKRNFTGHWPLATSKMLLQVTSQTIPNDIEAGDLSSLSSKTNVLVVAGERDHAVPIEAIEEFFDSLDDDGMSKILALPNAGNAGHDMLFRYKTAKEITQTLFEWMASIEGK